MSKWIRIATFAGASCLIVGSALAQSQNPSAQTPTEKDIRSGSESVRPIPPIKPPLPKAQGGRAASRGNQDVQAPRDNQDVQAPRGNQDVQAPRGNQEVQAPRDNQDVQAPRGTRTRNVRDNQDLQSPRMSRVGNGQDVRAAQEALKAKGFDPGEIDGRMGPHTQAAISEFQRSVGIRETGRFDQATLSQLGVGR
jgi:putative peptidoglycan binding protein